MAHTCFYMEVGRGLGDLNRPHLPSQRPHNLTSVYTSSGGTSLIHRTHLRNPEQSSGPKSSPSCQEASLKTPEAAGQGAVCSHTLLSLHSRRTPLPLRMHLGLSGALPHVGIIVTKAVTKVLVMIAAPPPHPPSPGPSPLGLVRILGWKETYRAEQVQRGSAVQPNGTTGPCTLPNTLPNTPIDMEMAVSFQTPQPHLYVLCHSCPPPCPLKLWPPFPRTYGEACSGQGAPDLPAAAAVRSLTAPGRGAHPAAPGREEREGVQG